MEIEFQGFPPIFKFKKVNKRNENKTKPSTFYLPINKPSRKRGFNLLLKEAISFLTRRKKQQLEDYQQKKKKRVNFNENVQVRLFELEKEPHNDLWWYPEQQVGEGMVNSIYSFSLTDKFEEQCYSLSSTYHFRDEKRVNPQHWSLVERMHWFIQGHEEELLKKHSGPAPQPQPPRYKGSNACIFVPPLRPRLLLAAQEPEPLEILPATLETLGDTSSCTRAIAILSCNSTTSNSTANWHYEILSISKHGQNQKGYYKTNSSSSLQHECF